MNYSSKKTDVYHFDDMWSLDILDIKDYGVEKKKFWICFGSNRQFFEIWLDSSFKK